MEEMFIDKNRLDAYTKTTISPSGKYKLTIELYATCFNTSDYTKGLITRISDNKIIFEIDRNYCIFLNYFYEKNGCEWLICGRSNLTQSFINLDEEIEYKYEIKSGNNFIWSACNISPNGKTLAVYGSTLDGPNEYIFYDISDIENEGWPVLKCIESLDIYDSDTDKGEWLVDGTFIWTKNREWSRRFSKWADELTSIEMEQVIEALNDEFQYVLLEQKILRRIDKSIILQSYVKN